ncbi:Ribosomal protein L30 family protein isoform 1 [Hibiscus syriacus]|uniref:Endoglucanase n=2 Tax=Hibiscus syriacus TaxID=106335 RepID=A0A6A2ZGL6_HIBSY|nr:Ribosomal protein L30 family protein isoform 1 [Hibiscus syriacus]
MQYVSNAAFLLTIYSDHLQTLNRRLICDRGELGSEEVRVFAKSQVDYILGENPKATSYLVGYGSRYPQRMHHRGGSIESYGENKGFIRCTQGYDNWFHRKGPNPNVIVGALIGGPNEKDEFSDDRKNFMQTEAYTYNTASLVGVLAKLHGLEDDGVFNSPLTASR